MVAKRQIAGRLITRFDRFFVALFLGIVLGGCSRSYYREQADRDVYDLVDQANTTAGGELVDYTINVDRRSRMFDPFDPDHPPMPQDDPTSHEKMHFVDGMAGYPCWHADGDTDQVANSEWLNYLPTDEEGTVQLDLRSALMTSRLHSTSYQQELEDLYLSALDVTFERFRFDVQFFGGESATFTADGPLRSGDSSSELDVSTRDVRMEKLFSTGGQLVVELANSLIWEFSGPDSHSVNTLLDFSLVQPLLRAGGRDRVLERLTIAERALLANVRQMERFHRGFFTEVATGRNAPAGPSRRGGFFGGSGLEGFSGVGGGGFGRVGDSGGGPRGDGSAGGAGAEDAGGYFGLLQDQREIINQEVNVEALRDSLARLDSSSRAPNLSPNQAVRMRFQLELARQALHNAESRLLTSKASYESRLDGFKMRLGMPPDIEIKIEDPLLAQFQLIDTELTVLQANVDQILSHLQPSPSRNRMKKETYREHLMKYIDELRRYQTVIASATKSHETLVTKLAVLDKDVEKLTQNIPKRRAGLEQLAQRKDVIRDKIAPEELSVEHFDKEMADLMQRHATLVMSVNSAPKRTALLSKMIQTDLQASQAELKQLPPNGMKDPEPIWKTRQQMFDSVASEISKMSDIVSDVWIAQARVRLESIVVAPIGLESGDAMQVARHFRRDWKNARASLVDSWRLVRFNADDLESDLNIIFSGDISTNSKNPVKFDSATGRLRAGIEFDAPITRLSERNNYRQALIEYQQARRSYYQFVDFVNLGLRSSLRTIRLNQLNFELRRAAVHTALLQVDLAREQLLAPAEIGANQQTADVGRDLVSALADLVQVQNDFLSVWLNYRVQLMGLDLDLGTMEVDTNGLWIERDDFGIRQFLPASEADFENGDRETDSDILDVNENSGSDHSDGLIDTLTNSPERIVPNKGLPGESLSGVEKPVIGGAASLKSGWTGRTPKKSRVKSVLLRR